MQLFITNYVENGYCIEKLANILKVKWTNPMVEEGASERYVEGHSRGTKYPHYL